MLVSLQNFKINFRDKSLKYSLWEEAGQSNLKKGGHESSSFLFSCAFPFVLQKCSDFFLELNGTLFKAHQKAAEAVFEVAVLVEQRTRCSFFWVQKRNQEVLV